MRVRDLENGQKKWVSDCKFLVDVFPYRESIGKVPLVAHDEVIESHRAPNRPLIELKNDAEVNNTLVGAKFVPEDPLPKTWKEAMTRPDREEWIKAAEVEIENHRRNATWKLVDRSESKGKTIFRAKTVLKIKRFPNGNIDKYKVCITTAAYTRMLTEGVDYEDKYAATPRWNSCRLIIALATFYDLDMCLADIAAFFLTAPLDAGEEIFMEQPEMNDDGTGRIAKLLKSNYGTPQASRHAQRCFMDVMKKGGYLSTNGDKAVFVKKADSLPELICSTHVDDTLMAGSRKAIDAALA